MTIKVGVIGFGLSARVFHLPFLAASRRYEVCAVSSSRTDEVKAYCPQAAVYDDAEEMIRESEAELIVNTAPNVAHFPLSALALRAGKHVVVEKPFVTNIADGEALIKLAAEQGRILTVYHNRRWDGDFLTVQKLLADNTLGPLRFFETHFDRFRPNVRDTWRESAGEGSGILLDLGSHLADQALYLFGKPQAVSADIRNARTGAGTDDMFRITLHYPDKLAVLVSSPFCAGPNLRFKLEGDSGSFIKYGLDPQEARLRAGQMPEAADWAAEMPGEYGTIYDGKGERPVPTVTGGYQAFYEKLAVSIGASSPPPVLAEEALTVLRLLEACWESARAGQTVAVTC